MIQHICIDYLEATKKALRIYTQMAEIIETQSERAQEIETKMTRPTATATTPVRSGGSTAEDSWARSVDQIEALEAKVEQAQEFMLWFSPAWSRLTEDERVVLEERYVIKRVAGRWETSAINRLHRSRSPLYKLSDTALKRLASFLVWPGAPLL